mmetsp:Transcript_29081/g.46797  ORF Transcript_29081/g.46797 Transcript_29081/m.46797 type:complete len:87 (-) Transcript_29081:170-430(-)
MQVCVMCTCAFLCVFVSLEQSACIGAFLCFFVSLRVFRCVSVYWFFFLGVLKCLERGAARSSHTSHGAHDSGEGAGSEAHLGVLVQ